MTCSKCKSPLPDNARFCAVCGQAVDVVAAPDSAAATAPAGNHGGGAAAQASPGWTAAQWSLPATLNRIKNILLTPKTEWVAIAAEPASIGRLYIGYLLPLTAWAAFVSLVRVWLVGTRVPFEGLVRTSLAGGLAMAAWTFVASFIGLFLVAWIVNVLAPTFGGTRNQTQALKVAAYSLTPAYAGSVLALSPILPTLLQIIVLGYGLYVLYLGLPVVMNAPKDRGLGYTATVVICTFLLGVVLSLIVGALGMFRHSGLSDNHAAAQERGAAAVGNAIGNALGTDAKGKAGLTAALSNLEKAGEQSSPPTAAPADSSEQPNAAASATTAGSARNAGAAVGGLLDALGGALGGDHPKQVVDFKALTPLLPTDLPNMKRTDSRGESQAAIGVKTASASGTYRSDSATVRIDISDMTALAGLVDVASALAQSTASESDSGFERNRDVAGRSVHEKYDAASKHGELTVMVAKRYQVQITGDGVDMSTLEQSLGHIDLDRLESMKDQGAAAK